MRKEKKYWHDVMGYNYRMTNLQAAVGVAQLERIEEFVERKREIARIYRAHLTGIDGIILPVEKEWAKHVYWMFNIRIDRDSGTRNKVIAALRDDGIESRPVFYLLHEMPPFKQPGHFPVAEAVSTSGISLPSAVTLNEEDIIFIRDCLRKYV
jgi:perosamine synthetase